MKTLIFNILFIIIISKIFAQSNCSYQDSPDISVSNLHSMAENSIFVHPNRPNIILNANNLYAGKIGAFVSVDWGNTWSGGPLLTTPAGDPATAIDLSGRMYIGYLDISYHQCVAWSTNYGVPWNPVTITISSTDKNHLWVDNSCESNYNGRVYSVWTEYGNQIVKLSFSSNQGISWSTPVAISSNGYTSSGVNLQTNKEGVVFIVWPVYSNQSWHNISIAKSLDGGVSWNVEQNAITGINSHRNYGVGPSMAINMQSDRIFVVWTEGILNEDEKDSDVNIDFMYSDDEGDNWNGPFQVNSISTGIQKKPWITCDPATGILACIYYDSRESSQDNYRNAYISVSTDDGESWCDLKIGDNGNANLDVHSANDYIGISMNKGIVYPCFSMSISSSGPSRTYVSPIQILQANLTVTPPITFLKYVASNSIITSGVFPTGQTINSEFIAGNFVELRPGFAAIDGSNFIARVQYCGFQGGSEGLDNLFQELRVNNELSEKDKKENLLRKYSLFQNYPNPFNPSTSIIFNLKKEVNVKLLIYDEIGRLVRTLVDESKVKGLHSVIWDGKNNLGVDVTSGIYFYKLIAGDFIDTKKMVLIR